MWKKSLPHCQETSDNANANRNPLVVSRVRKQSQTDDFYARKGYRSKTSRTRWCTSRTWWLGRFPAGERCAWSGRRKPCVETREERRGEEEGWCYQQCFFTQSSQVIFLNSITFTIVSFLHCSPCQTVCTLLRHLLHTNFCHTWHSLATTQLLVL